METPFHRFEYGMFVNRVNVPLAGNGLADHTKPGVWCQSTKRSRDRFSGQGRSEQELSQGQSLVACISNALADEAAITNVLQADSVSIRRSIGKDMGRGILMSLVAR